ncbi:cysteine-rich CWC family protein [Pseudomonas laurylsulfatiphila]|uniref:cysteine-rich CWC family protein n=1 Tax=Pseudomonas laurylsulfatiphila TaxID=2011015 RepID=UPI003D2326EA
MCNFMELAPTLPSLITHKCPTCEVPVKCEIAQGKSTCWCFTVKPQEREVDWGGQCLCTGCLTGKPNN